MRDPSLREPNGKNRAALGVVVRGDLPALLGDDGFAEGQANAVPCGIACTRAPVKAVKQMGQVLRGKARAAVVEGELGEQEGVLAADLEAAVVLHGVQGVFQEVLQGLCEPVPVSHPSGSW